MGVKNTNVFDLYNWKNGVEDSEVSPIPEVEFVPNIIMPTLQNNIVQYQRSRSQWRKAYFPIFNSGGGDYYLIEKEGRDQRIFFSSVEAFFTEKPFSMYTSIEQFVLTVLTCFEKKAYAFDRDGTYLVDFDLEQQIAASLNSDCELWDG